jgi:hypothetical protein
MHPNKNPNKIIIIKTKTIIITLKITKATIIPKISPEKIEKIISQQPIHFIYTQITEISNKPTMEISIKKELIRIFFNVYKSYGKTILIRRK